MDNPTRFSEDCQVLGVLCNIIYPVEGQIDKSSQVGGIYGRIGDSGKYYRSEIRDKCSQSLQDDHVSITGGGQRRW